MTETAKFMTDPLAYVKKVCVNLQTAAGFAECGGFDANQTYAPAYFDLVPWSTSLFFSTSQVMLKPQTAPGAGLIAGYYAPYLAYGTIVSNNIAMQPLVDVPANLPPYRFIFTGGQNGCSLLLLRGSAANLITALHYPNSDGKAAGYPLLAQIGKTAADILIAIDFTLYGETDNPNAASFFWHDGTQWVGVTQPQKQGQADMTWKRPSMSINSDKGPIKVTPNSVGKIT